MVMLKKKNERVVYFFIEHSNSHSLQADTILRTLISQSIDHLTIPSSIEEKLKWMKAAETTNIENWTTLLREVARTFSSFFIFVDVIDECDIKEQRAILEQLSSLVSSTPQVKIFLSGREGLRPELNKKIGNLQQVSLELGKSDIDMLVEQVLHVQVEDGDLQVGDMALLDEIKTRLVEHADGMWVLSFELPVDLDHS